MKKSPPSFQSRIDRGVVNIDVRHWDPQDPQEAANVIASFYLSTWDDPVDPITWNRATPDVAWDYAQRAANGEVLPNTLESLAITFGINGVARATTHQLVRTRVGAVFGQQGGRDNNWSDFNLRLPETWWNSDQALLNSVEDLQIQMNALYAQALAHGIPFQDARYVLPMGLETALVASYNLLSLKSLAERRLCNRMMWETNYVVRLMCDEVVRQYPWVGKNLRSICEKRGVCHSVSPMFPEADWTVDQRSLELSLAKDNPTLTRAIDGIGYDFPRTANGCYLHFTEMDHHRLEWETSYQHDILSLADGKTVLARRDDDGLWRTY